VENNFFIGVLKKSNSMIRLCLNFAAHINFGLEIMSAFCVAPTDGAKILKPWKVALFPRL
jgi:hypothetical protein